MTFGQKLQDARKRTGLSQEQLAEKLSVSRSAVAKWENDNGMPDIDNLKAMSKLLDVSIDYLSDDEGRLDFTIIKEAIDLDSFEKVGKCRDKYDAAVYAKYSDADSIQPLIRSKVLSPLEHIAEWTVMPSFGLFEAIDQINNYGGSYLVEKDDKQYLVRVDDEFMTTSQIMKKITEKKFRIGGNKYKMAGYKLI